MTQKPLATPFVLRYVYAILAIIALATVVVIGSLYVAQQDEKETRDRIEFFHLKSVVELQELAREARTLGELVEGRVDEKILGRPDAPGIHISHTGIVQSMRSRLAQLSALQELHGGEIFAATLARLVDRVNRIDRALRDSEISSETITNVEVLGATIEQYDRLHKIAADRELAGLADRQSHRPRFLGVLAVCLAASALAAWYLIASLRASLVQQKVTEIALAESQDRLHHIQKLDALGRLVGGVAHEFNNRLTAILGHAGLLQEEAAGDERFENSLNEITQAGLRAASLTQQLLAFSRRQRFEPRILDLNELIRGMEAMLQQIIGSDVQLTCNYADKLFAVELDPDQMQQVIMNLIGNARDAMPQGGMLSVSTENVAIGAGDAEVATVPAGEYARLTVSDNGVGMNRDTLRRLFEPFFTTKESGEGTGLGLSTVHGIVAGFNGHIVVESEEGTGSQFYLYFPHVEGRPAEPSNKTTQTTPPKGSETILLVEDNQQVRRFVETGLSSLGYRVLPASGGAAGLEICRSESGEIDVILSDVVMPEMSGPQFMISALRLRPAAAPIYMSAYTEDAVLQFRRSNPESEIPLIMKPFELVSLSRLIRECLGRRDNADLPS